MIQAEEYGGIGMHDTRIGKPATAQPVRTPADACVTASPPHRHGSGPVRVATALPYGSCIHYSPPVTGASPRITRLGVEGFAGLSVTAAAVKIRDGKIVNPAVAQLLADLPAGSAG
jgi:hypothetical protein